MCSFNWQYPIPPSSWTNKTEEKTKADPRYGIFFYGEKGYFVLNKPFPLQEIMKKMFIIILLSFVNTWMR